MTPEGGPSGQRERVWGLSFRVWIATACAVHVVAGAALFEPTLFPGGDNAGYMILGKALRTGAGYVDLHLPDAPVHAKYPPLYPAVLAVVGWMGGLQLFKALSLALTAASVGLAAALGGRWGGTRVGVLTGLALAVNPVLLDYSHYVLSEAPFVFWVLLSLWAATRSDERAGGAGYGGGPGGSGGDGSGDGREAGSPDGWFALALAAACAAFLTRTAGLPLLIAMVALPALRGRGRRAASAAATATVVAAGWALFQRLGAPGEAGYLQQLLMVDPYDPAAGSVDAAGLVARTARNFWRYVVDVFPASLVGASRGAGPLAGAAGIVGAGLAAAGWARRCLDEVRAGELFLFLYLGTVSAWPSVWTDQRFLLPALPLLLIYVMVGVTALAGALVPGEGDAGGEGPSRGGRLPAAAAASVAALVAAGGLWSLVDRAPERIRCLRAHAAGDPCVAPAQASFYAAARWASAHTAPDAVVVNRKPRIFYWISGRRGTVYPYSSEPEVVLRGIEEAGAEYVVVDRISGTTARYLVPAVEARRDRFEVVYGEGSPTTWILRFTAPTGTALRPGTAGDGDPGPPPPPGEDGAVAAARGPTSGAPGRRPPAPSGG